MEQELTPRLEEAKAGKRVVYFADAVHFVYGAFVACLWSVTRIFMPTPSGRNRYLEQIAQKKLGSSIPVTIVLDNARYQHCNYVIDRAKLLGIELLFLLSYSPNLNIIERLWKWTKKDCLNCKYYSKVSEFTEAINRSLMKTKNKENKSELDTQLSLNFQLYDHSIYSRT